MLLQILGVITALLLSFLLYGALPVSRWRSRKIPGAVRINSSADGLHCVWHACLLACMLLQGLACMLQQGLFQVLMDCIAIGMPACMLACLLQQQALLCALACSSTALSEVPRCSKDCFKC